MIQSRLVSRKAEIEHELRLMNYGAVRLDPRREQYLGRLPFANRARHSGNGDSLLTTLKRTILPMVAIRNR